MNYFGTNGIQGIFGSTINSGTAFLLGNSLSLVGGDCPIVVVASDTRPSSKELMQAVAVLQKITEYAQGNVSVAAICGYLQWALR